MSGSMKERRAVADRSRIQRRVAQGTHCLGAQGNRPHRHTRPSSMGARIAEDAIRQDHAPHLEEDCGKPAGTARRHIHPGRSLGGAAPGRAAFDSLTAAPFDRRCLKSASIQVVIPAKAGIHLDFKGMCSSRRWISARAGLTALATGSTLPQLESWVPDASSESVLSALRRACGMRWPCTMK